MNDKKGVDFLYRVVLYVLFTLGILVLGAGICFNVYWVKHEPSWNLYVLNMLPGLVFLAIWFVGKNIHKWGWFLVGLGVPIAIVFSGFVTFCNIGASLWLDITIPDNDPGCYESILERYHYPKTEWISHFPAKIPVKMANVHFFHLQRFLQGAMILQLRYGLPADEIKLLLEKSLARAKQVQDGQYKSYNTMGPNGIPSTYLCVGPEEDWPEDFKVIVLDAEDYTGNWNHGFSYGVAISTKRNEVVYWATDW
jgi:hypothetical protein